MKKEQTMKQGHLAAILLLGIGGGVLTSAVQWLLEHSILRKGQWTFVPYVLLIVAAAIYARRRQIQSFGQRFALFFWPIVIATLISWVYLLLPGPRGAFNPAMQAAVWAGVVLLAAVVSAVAAQFLVRPRAA